MNVILSPETQKLLDAQLLTGEYPSADALLRTALEQLQSDSSDDLDDATLAAIEEGLIQADSGQSVPWASVRQELASKFNVK